MESLLDPPELLLKFDVGNSRLFEECQGLFALFLDFSACGRGTPAYQTAMTLMDTEGNVTIDLSDHCNAVIHGSL